eukprot:7227427-Pyramimonas_sp.AAC.1
MVWEAGVYTCTSVQNLVSSSTVRASRNTPASADASRSYPIGRGHHTSASRQRPVSARSAPRQRPRVAPRSQGRVGGRDWRGWRK